MKELKVGQRVSITLEVAEQDDTCENCYFSDKEQLNILINGLKAVNTLIHDEVDFSQFLHKERIV